MKKDFSKEGHRVRMLFAFDGTDYSGWQMQGHDQVTIQQTVQGVLSSLFAQPVKVVASGRTDAGVHAEAQQAHFDVLKDPRDFDDLLYALRRNLPKSIVPRRMWLAPWEFHAQQSAVKKTYRYRIFNDPDPNPFTDRFATWVRQPLEVDRLQDWADILMGKHDFNSFRSQGDRMESTVREIFEARWERSGRMVFFSITGSGFMKQMVRNLVGTMLHQFIKGGRPEDFKDVLGALDRRRARAPAPPQGLFLRKVYYPPDLDSQCRKL